MTGIVDYDREGIVDKETNLRRHPLVLCRWAEGSELPPSEGSHRSWMLPEEFV